MTDVVIVNVAVTSTEGYDRDNLTLGVMQDQLVSEVAKANHLLYLNPRPISAFRERVSKRHVRVTGAVFFGKSVTIP